MNDDSSSDYELTVRVRNNRILARVRALGFANLSAFCKANKLTYSTVSQFVTMATPARRDNGEWRDAVLTIAAVLRCEPDDLFSARQAQGGLKSSVIRYVDEDALITLDAPEARHLIAHRSAADEDLGRRQVVQRFLGKLPPRERRVISRLHGLDGEPAQTLAELGRDMGIGIERVRQLAMQAYRRGRHLSNGALRLYGDQRVISEMEAAERRSREASHDRLVEEQEAEEQRRQQNERRLREAARRLEGQ